MPTYAKDTAVPADRTRAEIERTLVRFGATAFAYSWEADTRVVIAFRLGERMVRMVLPFPKESDFEYSPTGMYRSKTAQRNAYEQAIRQRWRALALLIKAQLEAIEAGIVTTEDTFLAYTMLPSGQTVGQWARPQIDRAIERGEMPPSLIVGADEPKLLTAGR